LSEPLPLYLADAIYDAKYRRHFGDDSELGAPAGVRSRKPPPKLLAAELSTTKPKVTVTRGELPRPHLRR